MNYLNQYYSYFKVVSGKFEGKYTRFDGGYWYSPSLTITNHINVSVSFDASEPSYLYSTDSLLSQYRVDGGPWQYFTNNGKLNDDFSNRVVSQSGLSGDILEFRIKFKGTNTSSSRHMIDNILVTGQQSGIFGYSGRYF